MRRLLYAPLLGLCFVAALAQTPPRGQNDLNQKLTNRWMRGPLPAAPETRFAPPLVCELCGNAAPKPDGPNRNAIERAIRALGARIFPGTGRSSLNGKSKGPGFRVFGGK